LVRKVYRRLGDHPSITTDGRYIYTVSEHWSFWVVEKWDLDVTRKIISYEADWLSDDRDRPIEFRSIAVNPVTGHIWLPGCVDCGRYPEWRIVVVGKRTHRRKWARTRILKPQISGDANGVVFDEDGNAYVYGYEGVVKYSKYGKLLAKTELKYEEFAGGVYRGGLLYLISWGSALYVFDSDLRKVEEIDLKPEISKHPQIAKHMGEGSYLVSSVTTSDRETIYVAGRVENVGKRDVGFIYALAL
jgi:hypothetical protein